MNKINVYMTKNKLLTLARYEVQDYYDKDSGEFRTTEPEPNKLVGYMFTALVEDLEEQDA